MAAIAPLRENNLLCLPRTPFVLMTTNSRNSWCIIRNLTRGMALNGPDQLWVADTRYLHLAEELGYLAIFLDAFSHDSQSAIGAFIETVHNQGNAVGNLSPHDQHEWRRLPTGPPGAEEGRAGTSGLRTLLLQHLRNVVLRHKVEAGVADLRHLPALLDRKQDIH